MAEISDDINLNHDNFCVSESLNSNSKTTNDVWIDGNAVFELGVTCEEDSSERNENRSSLVTETSPKQILCNATNRSTEDSLPTNNGYNNLEITPTVRKSERVKKNTRRKLDEEQALILLSSKRKGFHHKLKKKEKPIGNSKLVGLPFCCDKCKSPYVVSPFRQTAKKAKKKPCPRHKIDPVTKQLLTLCNACGLSVNNSIKEKRKRSMPMPTAEDKEMYLKEGEKFAQQLADALDNPDAKRLFCPQFKTKGCGCLQRFINGIDGEFEESKKRASHLLELLKEAKHLSQLKSYNVAETLQQKDKEKKRKRSLNIGLGNGQKKSHLFEEFVIQNRRYLRNDLQLCERATQYILCYSNNFLHKRLKTEPDRGPRLPRQKGKAALGLLVPLEDIPKQQCCSDSCISLALTHSHLLQRWRERASSGQSEARRVLAEMLTPCSGSRTNCYKFITMITGCSTSTICSVKEQMKRTCGDREPPEHGLKQWWKDHPRSKPAVDCSDDIPDEASPTTQNDSSVSASELVNGGGLSESALSTPNDSELQLQMTRQQVVQLQRQVIQQQLQIQQQEQIIQQQLTAPHILTQALQQILHGAGITNSNHNTTMNALHKSTPEKNQSITTTLSKDAETIQVQGKTLLASNSLSNILIETPVTQVPAKTVDVRNQLPTVGGFIATDFPSNNLPSVNITILQQPATDVEIRTEANSQPISSGISNLFLIDPSSLIISGNVSETVSDKVMTLVEKLAVLNDLRKTGVNLSSSCLSNNSWEENH